MKIYIVRHGETDLNKEKKLMGQRMNNGLNSNGINQANEFAKDISEENFDVIFTSPLKRAYQTAQIIADKIKVPILERNEILERDFGSFSGKTWEEMKIKSGLDNVDFQKKDLIQEYDYRPHGGESVEDVKNRFLKFIDELRKNYSDKKILIIAHGGILKLAHFVLLEKKLDHTPHNASIHEFDI